MTCSGHDVDDLPELPNSVLDTATALVVLLTESSDFDPISSVSEIARRGMNMPIFVHLALYEKEQIYESFKAGADDVVTGTFDPKYYTMKIMAADKRKNIITGKTPEFEQLGYMLDGRSLTFASTHIKLSKREHAVMNCLLPRLHKDVSRDVIFNNMYGFNPEVDPRVVDIYIHRLRQKLEKNNALLEIQTISGFGYRMNHAGDKPLKTTSHP